MISVLVPVFNIEVVSLITELDRQLNTINIPGEILVFDDNSSFDYRDLNKAVAGLPHVVYKELDKNYGRTAIRQLLASDAKYKWLLFLDSDSRILHHDFLQQYLNAFEKGFDVYTGGRIYPSRPVECNRRLHWNYGVERESVKGNKAAFHTNNFCIRKEVFQQLQFPDFPQPYGHEDTWMGIELERLNNTIFHFNNAVEHICVEETPVFLGKTKQALQNLLFLAEVTNKDLLRRHAALFKTFSVIKQFRLGFVIHFLYRSFEKKIEKNLNSCNPSLSAFDIYRLYHLMQLSKKGHP